jgi:hypothetical protein
VRRRGSRRGRNANGTDPVDPDALGSHPAGDNDDARHVDRAAGYNGGGADAAGSDDHCDRDPHDADGDRDDDHHGAAAADARHRDRDSYGH